VYVKRSRDELRRHPAQEIRQTVAFIARRDETIRPAGVVDHAAKSRSSDVVIGKRVDVFSTSLTSESEGDRM
jgi:hypothetical protein